MERLIHIYGDNIVECGRALEFLLISLDLTLAETFGNPTNLQVTAKGSKEHFCFVFFPGLKKGRWTTDIEGSVSSLGGVLRESADSIVTEVKGNEEVIIFAIEFCSALPAGNQAWQRSGRAYSFAKASIPYIFITEIGGYELDANRLKINSRLPNPAVPFSFVSYPLTEGAEVFSIYIFNPGADDFNKKRFSEAVNINTLYLYIRCLMLGESSLSIRKEILANTKNLAKAISQAGKSPKFNFSPSDWDSLYDSIESGKDVIPAIKQIKKIPWAKKVKSGPLITNSARHLMALGAQFGFGLTAKDLPINYIPAENAKGFLEALKTLYKLKSTEVDDFFGGKNDVAICWINGFKPKGDDSRPDRGLLPLLRMLVGDDTIVLTIIFGPASTNTWKTLEDNPLLLGERNGLWEVLLGLSDGIIVDSTTLLEEKRPIIHKSSHWNNNPSNVHKIITIEKQKSYVPKRYGEHDVDSVIHILFKFLSGNFCFESLCNPPGGDWSGVSIQQNDSEYRWLSLPRVSRSGSKRPDHVIQFYDSNILLSIESKDYLKNLEENIGDSLNQYINELISSEPSCTRKLQGGIWSDKVDDYTSTDFKNVSGAAIIKKDDLDINNVLLKSKCDLGFIISFDEKGFAEVFIKLNNKKATPILNSLKTIKVPNKLKMKLTFLD